MVRITLSVLVSALLVACGSIGHVPPATDAVEPISPVLSNHVVYEGVLVGTGGTGMASHDVCHMDTETQVIVKKQDFGYIAELRHPRIHGNKVQVLRGGMKGSSIYLQGYILGAAVVLSSVPNDPTNWRVALINWSSPECAEGQLVTVPEQSVRGLSFG